MPDEVVNATPTPQEMSEAQVIPSEGIAKPAEGYTPLFEKAPTEAELRGEEETLEGEEKAKEEPKKEEGEKPKEEEKQETPAEDKKEEKPKEEESKETPKEEPKDGKPPKGFVPLKALHEARAEIDRLRRENELLAQLPAADETETQDKGFKVLTEEEEDLLMQEDKDAYLKYTRELRKHEAVQSKKVQSEAYEKSVVEHSFRQMATVVPGIFDEDSDVNTKLTEFATNNGMSPDMLSVLTNPQTKVLIPGQKNPVLLGRASVAVVDLLHRFYSKANAEGTDPTTLRADIEKELRASLTEEITKKVTQELTSKFKTNTPGYRSIGDTPGAGEVPSNRGGNLTEADFKKMTPAERAAALGGA